MTSATNESEWIAAHIFESVDGHRLGFTADPLGANLPAPRMWLFKRSFELAADRSVPANVPPEPILRGLRDVGYYVWRKGATHATSQ